MVDLAAADSMIVMGLSQPKLFYGTYVLGKNPAGAAGRPKGCQCDMACLGV